MAQICTTPPYTICLSAPQLPPLPSGAFDQSVCGRLVASLAIGGVTWPTGAQPAIANVTCGVQQADRIPSNPYTVNPMFYNCE